MGREARVIKPRTFTYWPNSDGAKRRTTMTRVTDARGARTFAHRMVRWYLDGLWTKAQRQNANSVQVSNSANNASTGGGADL